jgi:hypothetical protein
MFLIFVIEEIVIEGCFYKWGGGYIGGLGVASLFDESTEMYRQGNYPVCLALLSDCILLEPAHSTLFSNRAISNFGLKWPDDALSDLQRSIEINHLNYIAYSNLFLINLYCPFTQGNERRLDLHYAYNNK